MPCNSGYVKKCKQWWLYEAYMTRLFSSSTAYDTIIFILAKKEEEEEEDAFAYRAEIQ